MDKKTEKTDFLLVYTKIRESDLDTGFDLLKSSLLDDQGQLDPKKIEAAVKDRTQHAEYWLRNISTNLGFCYTPDLAKQSRVYSSISHKLRGFLQTNNIDKNPEGSLNNFFHGILVYTVINGG